MSEKRRFQVYCRGDILGVSGSSCGIVVLTDEQYDYQMNRPDEGWSCPRCLSSAEWIEPEDGYSHPTPIDPLIAQKEAP